MSHILERGPLQWWSGIILAHRIWPSLTNALKLVRPITAARERAIRAIGGLGSTFVNAIGHAKISPPTSVLWLRLGFLDSRFGRFERSPL
jgi:hypothetical protein